MITLRDITRDNIHDILALEVAADQAGFYPHSNAYSIAEAGFPADDDPVWMRAIYKDDLPVGFMMTSENPGRGEYFLWRLMIDRHHQGKGHARQAVRLLIDRLSAEQNSQVLLTSHMRGNNRVAKLFRSLGFDYTGEELAKDDLLMRLSLRP